MVLWNKNENVNVVVGVFFFSFQTLTLAQTRENDTYKQRVYAVKWCCYFRYRVYSWHVQRFSSFCCPSNKRKQFLFFFFFWLRFVSFCLFLFKGRRSLVHLIRSLFNNRYKKSLFLITNSCTINEDKILVKIAHRQMNFIFKSKRKTFQSFAHMMIGERRDEIDDDKFIQMNNDLHQNATWTDTLQLMYNVNKCDFFVFGLFFSFDESRKRKIRRRRTCLWYWQMFKNQVNIFSS